MDLNEITILDLTRLLPGGYATQLLCDMGAEVIKIEEPRVGDYFRDIEPMADNDMGAYYNSINVGKRSMTLDLKSDKGKQILYEMVAEADVVFEQFRPGVADQLDIDYETLREYNEQLVYCSLTGYGQDGPYSDRAGHDLNYLGFAGLLDMNRSSEEHAPAQPGIPLGDMSGGLVSAFMIVAALLDRELNEQGTYIDISVLDALLSLSQLSSALAFLGQDPRPGETFISGQFPSYAIYETKDGRHVTLAAFEPKFWERFCELVGKEELIDHHMSPDPEIRETVTAELREVFAMRTANEWEEELGAEDTMFGLIHTPAEVTEDPQVRAREMIHEGDGPLPRFAFPGKISSGVPVADGPIPDKGEHTSEVLKEFGIDPDAPGTGVDVTED